MLYEDEALSWENKLEKEVFVELFLSSGFTIPAEIIVLNASSTDISKSLTEPSGTRVYQPVVGLGAVGIKTLNKGWSGSVWRDGPTTVSYTHLTLPTIYSV